ncbi:Transcription factor SOX-1 [Quaeritorhiza haematococci]|nr:Transcription factor SOX-1 [Quaeritorhiza haematococci]
MPANGHISETGQTRKGDVPPPPQAHDPLDIRAPYLSDQAPDYRNQYPYYAYVGVNNKRKESDSPPTSVPSSTMELPAIQHPPQPPQPPQVPGPPAAGVATSTPDTNSDVPSPAQKHLKKPPNPFLLYNREMRKKLQDTNPSLSVGEISKMIGEGWKSLSDEDRAKYQDQAKQLKDEWDEARRLQQLEGLDSSNGGKGSKGKGRKNRSIKEPGQPKHPMSAFLYFLTEVRPKYTAQYPGSPVGPISRMIAEAWRAMSSEEKVKYENKAHKDKARYASEMKEYLEQKHRPSLAMLEGMNNSTGVGPSSSPQAYAVGNQGGSGTGRRDSTGEISEPPAKMPRISRPDS